MSVFDALVGGDRLLAMAPPSPRWAGGALSRVAPGGWTPAGATSVTAERAYAVPTVMACVNLISQTIEALPRRILERGDRTRTPVRDPAYAYLWGRPNGLSTGQTFWGAYVRSLLLWGNAYAWKGLDGARPAGASGVNELWLLPPSKVQGWLDQSTGEWAKRFRLFGDEELVFGTEAVLHTPAPGTDGAFGVSFVRQAAVALAIAAEAMGNQFFRTGMTLNGVIVTKGPQKAETLTALKERFLEVVKRGAAGVGDVVALDNDASFQRIGIPPGEAQFLETRDFQRDELLQMFRVPPHMLGMTQKQTSWGTGVEQQSIGFLTYTLLPLITALEEAVEADLLPDGLQMRFDVRGLLRTDMKTRGAFYSQMRDIGAFSADELREFEDLAPRPIEDDFTVKSGNVRIVVPNARRLRPGVQDDRAALAAGAPLEGRMLAPALEAVLREAVLRETVGTAEGEAPPAMIKGAGGGLLAAEASRGVERPVARCPQCRQHLGRPESLAERRWCRRCKAVVSPVADGALVAG